MGSIYLAYLPEMSAPLIMSQRYSARLRKKLQQRVINIDSL